MTMKMAWIVLVMGVVTATSAPAQTTESSQPAAAVPDMPAPGHSVITFGGTKIDVAGRVEVRRIAQKPYWQLVLPSGASPLPADQFDASPIPDGRMLYTPKVPLPLTVDVSPEPSQAPYPSVTPHQLNGVISVDNQKVTVANGVVKAGDRLLSAPYTYKHPVQLTQDVVSKPLFGSRTVILSQGAQGFIAGKFSGDGGGKLMFCFFVNGQDNAFGKPACFLNLRDAPFDMNALLAGDDMSDISYAPSDLELAPIATQNNLPLRFSATGSSLISGYKSPAPKTDGVEIQHDFSLELVSLGWADTQLNVMYLSEGQEVCRTSFKALDDGAVHLPLADRSIIIRRVQDSDNDSLIQTIPLDTAEDAKSSFDDQPCS